MSEELTPYTVSFRPGGAGYESPLLVIRANTEEDLLSKLGAEPDGDLGDAIGTFDAEVKNDYQKAVAATSFLAPVPAGMSIAPVDAVAAAAPVWKHSAPDVAVGPPSPNADGTYPPCKHGSRPRKPWNSPRTGKPHLFCQGSDKTSPDACPTWEQQADGTWTVKRQRGA